MVCVYGLAGIPIYWIINLVDRRVEVYTDPRPDGYATRLDFALGSDVPVVIDDVVVGRIAVDALMP